VWREIEETENFWASLPPLEPGILKRVQDLAERHRWEIFFVTQRPDTAGETVQRQTQRWLIEQGFDLPSVVVMSSSRGRLAEAMRLDYLIDDSPLHCADAASESDTKPVLVVRHDDPQRRRGAREMGIAIVPTVAAALDLLEQAQEMGKQPGFWKRLTGSLRGSRG
jgi:hypothetical protein